LIPVLKKPGRHKRKKEPGAENVSSRGRERNEKLKNGRKEKSAKRIEALEEERRGWHKWNIAIKGKGAGGDQVKKIKKKGDKDVEGPGGKKRQKKSGKPDPR